jgi:hypothetical protein
MVVIQVIFKLFLERAPENACWTPFKIAQESTVVPCHVLLSVFLLEKSFVEVLTVDSRAFEPIWAIEFVQSRLSFWVSET